jgi:hypothetical protein
LKDLDSAPLSPLVLGHHRYSDKMPQDGGGGDYGDRAPFPKYEEK